MARWGSTRTTRTVLFVAVVVFAFWRPLLAGGTLAPDDQVWSTAPWSSDAPADLTIEVAEPDAIAVHSAWSRWGEDLRDGSLSQLGDGRTGAPTLADGVPFTHLTYALVPAWYAPGLVAAAVLLLAMFGAARLLDGRNVAAWAATFGGVAFGLSGLLFSWVGWPHATAFALVPWVLAAGASAATAVDRRSIAGFAVALAALAWCGVWAITAFTLIGLAAVTGLGPQTRRGWLAVGAGVVSGLALAAPHLLASRSRWEWADTSMVEAATDSSAALSSVLTLAFGSIWGADAVGFPWIGTSSAQLSVAAVGLVVVALASIGVLLPGERRLPGTLAVLGLGVAYVGGPFAWSAQLVAGSGAEMTHARVLLVLGVIVAAAHGLSAMHADARIPSIDRTASATGVAVVAVTGWAALDWFDAARSAGAIRTAVAESTMSVLALGIFVTVAISWRRGALAGEAVGIAVTGLVVVEALSFGMAIPTVTDRHERLEATAAHVELADLLGADGVVVGEGRALLPVAAARFGPADLRVPRPRSVAEMALLRTADDRVTRSGGSPTQPVLGPVDVRDPAWHRFGVDAFVVAPGRRPPGVVTQPIGIAAGRIDPAGGTFTTVAEIEDGVRAIELDLEAPVATRVEIDVTAGGRLLFGDAVVVTGSPVVVPVEGDRLDGPATIAVRVHAEPETATLGVDEAGAPVVGVIGAGDDGTLVIVDGLLIVHRPVPAITDAGGADIVIDEVDDRTLRFTVESARPTDVWTDIVDRPGWTATVNGSSGYLARDVVLGVGVPAGVSEIELQYRPPGLLLGGLVIVVTALAWALVGSIVPTRRSPDDESVAGSVRSRD